MKKQRTEAVKPSPVYWFARLVDALEKKDFTLANVANEKLGEAGYRVQPKTPLVRERRPATRREGA